jgi:hypothetical protein
MSWVPLVSTLTFFVLWLAKLIFKKSMLKGANISPFYELAHMDAGLI